MQTPEDLESAITALSSMLKEKNLEILKNWPEEDAIGRTHFRVGQWMRNNWGLWGRSKLAEYFRSLGVDHGDDMSAIIVNCLHCRLNNKGIALEEQVAFYRRWWVGRGGGPSYADFEQLRFMSRAASDRRTTEEASGPSAPARGRADAKHWIPRSAL